MASQVSEKRLSPFVLMQAMQAQKTIRPQRDRLLQLRRQLEQFSPGDDDHAQRNMQLAADLFKACYSGIGTASRLLASCIELAAKNGVRLAINRAFAAMPDEQLHDALLAHRFPARPTTLTEAFSRVEATFNAVKVIEEHHIPGCIEHLVGRRPAHVRPGENPAPVAATPVDLDKARDYLHRACTLADLAVKHIDLAVTVISSFMDPEQVANLSEVTDKRVLSMARIFQTQ